MLFCCLLLNFFLVGLCKDTPEVYQPFFPTENYHGEFFQGDIFFRNGSSMLDRFATTYKSRRWANGEIPYTLDDLYSGEEVDLIHEAMAEFEKQTCIKWVERTDQEYFVEIYSDMGCWSELGRIGGVQSLSLESPICIKKGVIMHEMMHAAGFLHEQSRYDRDDYVEVIWDNIVEGMEPNFEKMFPYDIDTLGQDYDYHSIMHYRSWMFAKDRRQPTLKPTNHQVSLDEMGSGQRDGVFSDLDLKKINLFYECPAR